MVLHVHGQVVALLGESGKLLAQGNAPVVMEARVPVVHPGHHGISLEVKCFVGLPWLLFFSFFERTLTL